MDAQTKAFAQQMNINIRVVLEGPARARRDMMLRTLDRRIQVAEDDGLKTDDLVALRQKVREIPQQPWFPEKIEWPEIPGGA